VFGFGRHCTIDAASFFYRGDSLGPIGDKTTTGAYANFSLAQYRTPASDTAETRPGLNIIYIHAGYIAA